MTKDVYKVIHNPLRVFFKHEVWVHGETATQDSNGYLKYVIMARNVKAFRKQEEAEGYIKYQQEIAEFRGIRGRVE